MLIRTMVSCFPINRNKLSQFLPRQGGIWLRRALRLSADRFVAEFIPQSGAPQLLFLHPRQIRNGRFTRPV
jgi:hypothetical protein